MKSVYIDRSVLEESCTYARVSLNMVSHQLDQSYCACFCLLMKSFMMIWI